MSAGVKDKSLNPYTIYLCMYLCKVCVCDERGGGRGGGLALTKIKLISLFYKVHEKT